MTKDLCSIEVDSTKASCPIATEFNALKDNMLSPVQNEQEEK